MDVLKQVSVGDFLHVNVYTSANKKKISFYVCKALSDIDEDGEVKVVFLRAVTKDAKRFRIEETDISYVDYEDIITILPTPAIVKRGHRIYYEFKTAINIFEK
ncbi:unnamed protein product [Diatraea saccharalis]|uniref:Uncharacterized protein n=1 Tax=Diatraea saccharalis TaxID=40085 RepID=A0A9N9R9F1_9NEOP|nr:unnamed protein product [Diatraea saccharalis]